MPDGKRVHIVDDDASIRDGLYRLLSGLGYDVTTHGSAAAFLADAQIDRPCCLLLDVCLADQSGFRLQQQLLNIEAGVAIVFMTGHGDIAMGVRAMKAGAIDFLTKPLRTSELVSAIELALANSCESQRVRLKQLQARELYARLTPREREVLALVLMGARNKQIADALESQEATVKVHRSRLMRKLEARTLAELLQIGQQLGMSAGVIGERGRGRHAEGGILIARAPTGDAARSHAGGNQPSAGRGAGMTVRSGGRARLDVDVHAAVGAGDTR